MKDQPNRLDSNAGHFAGAAILRSRPISFRVNGRQFSACEGDTVLSALLACGVDTLGMRKGWPLGLSYRHAPPIFPADDPGNPAKALPMERTPVTAGAQYVTFGSDGLGRIGAAVSRLRGIRSLGLDLDDPAAMHRPWLDGQPHSSVDADVVVVGGGIAGMTAAFAAAKGGNRVILVEAGWQLGGHARLFGSQEGQETPDQSISRLVAAIAQDHTITVMLGTQAFAVRPGVVRVHAVAISAGVPSARTLDISAPRIVLATGVIERLPVFAGNRLPGVWTSLESYSLAQQYGVWPGKTALFATGGNIAYRLAMLASDAGVAVVRILDARTTPQSRFVEFAKAYGITMAVGTTLSEVDRAPKNRGLAVIPGSALHKVVQPEEPLVADRLVLTGCWQPELTLWHMAGGSSRWNSARVRLEPELGSLKGIGLAGSAAGYLSGYACMQSGKAAVARLFGRRRIPVEERLIDPIYETPDVPVLVAPRPAAASAPAFLDGGQSYIESPEPRSSRLPAWLPLLRRAPAGSLADMPQPLALGDIAAGAQLGIIPPESAGIVAQERVPLIAIKTAQPETAEQPAPTISGELPAYLLGRFGADSFTCHIASTDPRRLETGALIYTDADETDPFKAIGVVVRGGSEAATGLLAASARSTRSAFVREGDRAFAIRISPPRAERELVPTLGSGAGAL